MNPRELSGAWREKAEQLRRYSESAANAWEDAAAELEATFAAWELEALPPDEASHESGYSRSQLDRLATRGKIENAGAPGAPKYPRCDLPRKAGRRQGLRVHTGDLADEILARRAR